MVMFHSIGLQDYPWLWSHLSEPVELFEQKVRMLAEHGFRTVFWQELYDHMAGKNVLKGRHIALTFDDGYLDNRVYVFPILKKYGVKATIFVNPDFVDPATGCRSTTESVDTMPAAQAAGFLGWDELRDMQESGLVDIQSHAMTHTWYFGSPELVDFHHPGDAYPWLAWNACPERKPFYMVEDQSNTVNHGTPVFRYQKSLVAPRFQPNPEPGLRLAAFAAQQGNDFWIKASWRGRLSAEWDRITGGRPVDGMLETDSEYRARVAQELGDSRRIISEQLDKPVDFICWPGGGYNNTVLEVARESGYRAWTLSSRDRSDFRNFPTGECEQVKRIGSTPVRQARGYALGPATAGYFYRKIRAHQGSLVSDAWLKAGHALGIARARLVHGGG